MPCVLTKNSSYVYSNTTLVHTAFFKPTVMKRLVVVVLVRVVNPSKQLGMMYQ